MLKFKKGLRNQQGFTLLEVLLVVAIIAILAGIVIIAINPGKQLADSRNAQRSADVTTILNAIYQYSLDNNGSLPAAGGGVVITTTVTEICKTNAVSCTGLVDLGVGGLTVLGKYLVSMPIDPSCPTNCAGANGVNGTGYKVAKDANGRITVDATLHIENSKTITVTR